MKHRMPDWAEALSRRRMLRLRLFAGGAAAGLAAGLSVALYRWLIGEAETLRTVLATQALEDAAEGSVLPFALWAAGLLAAALVLSALCRWEPMASGSGIPQVKGMLLGWVHLRWLRVLLVQIFGGALAIGAGLSLGHAGPAVEIGAAAAQGTSRAAGRRRAEERCLVTGGAGAGLAAVFNAPLAGMLFALEELHHTFSASVILPAMAASVTAACTVRFFFGSHTIFLFTGTAPLEAGELPWVVLLGAVCGAAAVPLNAGLLAARRFYGLPCFRTRERKIGFALALAGLAAFLCPALTGGGDRLINAVTQCPPGFFVLAGLALAKSLFTFASFGSGVPGGFFFPSLTVGALTGAAAGTLLIDAGLLPPEAMTNVIILSMAAFFAGSVRAPITGAVLLLEMTGRFEQLMPLALAAATAYVASGLLGGVPIYEALLRRQRADAGIGTLPEPRLVELAVENGSALDGRRTADLPLPPRTVLAEIRRGGEPIVPGAETVVRAGDQLAFLTQCGDAAQLERLVEGTLPAGGVHAHKK